jgi:hypothetical protein
MTDRVCQCGKREVTSSQILEGYRSHERIELFELRRTEVLGGQGSRNGLTDMKFFFWLRTGTREGLMNRLELNRRPERMDMCSQSYFTHLTECKAKIILCSIKHRATDLTFPAAL